MQRAVLAPDMTFMVVSPHLDDGVLSLGGLLASRAGTSPASRIVTLFSGSPDGPISRPAQAFHDRCGLSADTGMNLRRAEDLAACEGIGVMPVHMGLLEALYRRDRDGGPRYTDGRQIFDADLGRESYTLAKVVGVLDRLLEALRPMCVAAPLGIGGHVDHLLAKRATELAVARLGSDAPVLVWYEDLPYALYEHLRGWEDRYAVGLSPRHQVLSDDDWSSKVQAVSCYTSQLEVLWYDTAPWQEQLLSYAISFGSRLPAERVWVKEQ